MIKAVLFDKDGTLIEFESMWHQVLTIIFKDIERLPAFNSEAINVLKEYSGYTETGFLKDSIIKYLSTSQIIQKWLEILSFKEELKPKLFCEVMEIFRESTQNKKIKVQLLDDVPETLEYLISKNYFLGIATADTKASALHYLRQAELLKYFSFIGSDDGLLKPKPDPEMAVAFCQQVKIECHELLIVGDSISDYEFAKKSGSCFIGIKEGFNSYDYFDGERITLVDSINEIIDLMNL